MNTEIVRELARQWREAAEPMPMQIESASEEKMISHSLLEKKLDEVADQTLKRCAQDLEDVIRIYTEFKYKR